MSTENDVSAIPEITTNQTVPLVVPRVVNPFIAVAQWFTTQTISDIPENVMGWLVAQGFEITNIRQDNTTVPPTNYFSVRKDGLNPAGVLLSLCNSFTTEANNARTANQIRYNDILANMELMVDSSHDQFDAQIAEQNAQSGVFLADLDEYMTAIETMITDNQAQVVVDANNAKIALDQMLVRLGDLETNATDNASQIQGLFSEQATNLAAYVNEYDSRLAELDQNFAAYLADVLSKIANLDTTLDGHIADYSQQFAILASNYTAHASDIESKMAVVRADVDVYTDQVETILDLLEEDYEQVAEALEDANSNAGNTLSQYAGDYGAILVLLRQDYEVHAQTARGFLINLGQTDLARINEQFASSLSTQLQMMVSRGLSMATMPIDITARNQRDRDEQIQTLNDRLNREKLDNQHKLYEQQVNVRARDLDATDRLHSVRQEVLRYQATLVTNTYSLRTEATSRILAGRQAVFAAKDANSKYGIEISSNLYAKLQDIKQRTIDSVDRIYQLRDVFAKWETEETNRRYERIQQIEAQYLEGIQRQYLARQDISKIEISERNVLLAQLQAALTALMSGKERYAVLLMQNANTLAEHKHRAIAEMVNTKVQRLEGWKSVAAENMRLMTYQLDERNKLLMAVYAFVERREDIGPQWNDMAKMIAGLGDSGGGWLTPN
jgi:hypothetical protein